ncbi:MAG: DEAD/DEAH box helicase [Fibromonadaceae bacterium]|jgi:ATP-dependent RNA helicase DeaD|nr:DEAD/DEAH box helicase [Fibromonadaceae bacterium]
MENENENPFSTPIKIKEPQNKLPDFLMENLPEHLQATLRELGWNELMPVQKKTIPYMMQGRDMLIQSKTGSGKTGAFLLPLLQVIVTEHIFPQALILVPTRELALQVHGEAEKLSKGTGIRSCAIFGGVGFDNQIHALRTGVHIIVATPGRLLDHAQRGNIDFGSIRDLVMDEADEMLGMGFYPDMQRVRRFLPKEISCTMFSATIPQTVKSLAREFQRPNADFLSLSYDQVIAKNLEHRYYASDAMGKDSLLIKILEWENPESCMVFCNMKKDVAYLEQVLNDYGFASKALSGDISQKEREQVLGEFRDNKLKLLICTDVAARGIDVTHVTHVIVYDHPSDHEVYVHRSGRTARAGRSGLSISLITPVEEIEIQKTAADFGINFIKMPPISEEELASRIRQRAEAKLDRERRFLGQKQNERMRRYIPMVEELSQNTEGKELLAYLLDSFYWKP